MFYIDTVIFVFLAIAVIAYVNPPLKKILLRFVFTVNKKEKKTTLKEDLRNMSGLPPLGFWKRRDFELKQMLEATNRGSQYAVIKLFMAFLMLIGVLVSVLLKNYYLLPVLMVCGIIIPTIYLKKNLAQFKKNIDKELEIALSVITTSYMRVDNIVAAIEENIPKMQEPVKTYFAVFVASAKSINPNIVVNLEILKNKIDNKIWIEWIDALIQSQTDNTYKFLLSDIVQKFSAVRVTRAELNAKLANPKKTTYTLMAIVPVFPIFIGLINPEMVSSLWLTQAGKCVIAVAIAIYLIVFWGTNHLAKPIEYGGDY